MEEYKDRLIELLSEGKESLAEAFARRWGLSLDGLKDRVYQKTVDTRGIDRVLDMLRRNFDDHAPESYAITR